MELRSLIDLVNVVGKLASSESDSNVKVGCYHSFLRFALPRERDEFG